MTDAQQFRDFMRHIDDALKLLDSSVTDLEIGFDPREAPWMFYGARACQNVDEDAPLYRLGSGAVQIRHVRGTPQVRIMLGKTVVDIVPRRV